MKLLESKKFELPSVYFISDRNEIKGIPPGVPFIYGDPGDEEYLIRILEYEVLYRQAKLSGFPFNFKQILLDNGYLDMEYFSFENPLYMEFASDEFSDIDDYELCDMKLFNDQKQDFKRFIKDNAVYVDIEKLKQLNVFPIWLDKIEQAIHTNIHNFAVFNNNMYNKKLEGMYGAIDLVAPNRNLLIVDISGSIPRGVSSTLLTLCKNLSESFYTDLMITGSKSTLYTYENLHALNIKTIYEENGMDNDQAWFKKLVTQEKKRYKTAIVFGDNHSPCHSWSNAFNKGCKTISREKGQKICEWEVEKLISFHTSNRKEDDKNIAGYADWFTPKEIEYIHDWVKYLEN